MSSSQLPTSGVAPAELEVDPGKENVVSTSFSNAAEAEVGVKRKSADDADEPGQSRARITDNEAVPPKTAAETTEERPASSLPKGSPEMVEGCSANNLPEDSTDCQVTDLSQVTKPKKKKRKSTEPLPRMVKTRNNFFGIKHRGQALGPNIGKHIKVEFVRPLMVTLRTNFKPTECVVDCYGLRYHLLIRQNKKVHDCLENRCLGKADADIYNNHHAKWREFWLFLDPFWPVVAEDCDRKKADKENLPTFVNCEVKKDTTKFQLKTDKEGKVNFVPHKIEFNFYDYVF